MSDPFLSVVIPAFNEEARLEASLRRITSFFAGKGWPFEILVVDDGSQDRTGEVAAGFQASGSPAGVRVVRNDTNRGKGYSVRRGMLAALGCYTLLTDADLSTPIEEFDKLEEPVIEGGIDIAFGSRDIEGSQVLVHQSLLRETSGKLFNRLVRLLTGLPYRDTQCGFKLFKMQDCRDIFREQRIERFAFDVEVLVIAGRWGLKLAEVPVKWRHSDGSKVSLFPDGPLMILDLLMIRLNVWTGRYSKRGEAVRESRSEG